MSESAGYLFGKTATERIKAAVLKSEAPPGSAGGPAGQPVLWNPGVLEAIVTTAITAASGLTYGTGAAQIYIDNGSGVAISDPAYPSPVTVLNWSQNSGTIATTTHIQISWRNGGWRFNGGDC